MLTVTIRLEEDREPGTDLRRSLLASVEFSTLTETSRACQETNLDVVYKAHRCAEDRSAEWKSL